MKSRLKSRQPLVLQHVQQGLHRTERRARTSTGWLDVAEGCILIVTYGFTGVVKTEEEDLGIYEVRTQVGHRRGGMSARALLGSVRSREHPVLALVCQTCNKREISLNAAKTNQWED
jgi:hypothetical protein